jgi:hypothetical protein
MITLLRFSAKILILKLPTHRDRQRASNDTGFEISTTTDNDSRSTKFEDIIRDAAVAGEEARTGRKGR